jgi:fructose/tagatose bisphosphate aldolase
MVHENIKLNAERMKKNYCKRKKMQVRWFKIGDNVAVKVPKEDRHKAEVHRIPAVVVKVKNGIPNMYRLACSFGTIHGYYT